jgi:hypothetical protein
VTKAQRFIDSRQGVFNRPIIGVPLSSGNEITALKRTDLNDSGKQSDKRVRVNSFTKTIDAGSLSLEELAGRNGAAYCAE